LAAPKDINSKGCNLIKIIIAFFILYLGLSQITSVYANNSTLFYENQLIHPEPPSYSAASVVLIEASTGMVLYSTGGDEIKYPASITKIMTALIVLEQTTNFDERILFSERAIADTPRHTAHIAMDVGETLTVEQALYALMLPSANEVSLALAEHIAGSVEEFVELMNRRAHSLGANNTYFVNPSGLPGAGHVTTAYDMALIMREAVQHPLFVDVIRTRRFDIPPTERQPEIRALRNTNRLIQEDPHFNQAVVGGKTGWTNAAGHTLVTYAEQNGRRLIVSVLDGNSPGTFVDTNALLDYGFNLPFEATQIFDASINTPAVPIFTEVDGSRTEIGRVTLQASDNIYFDLPSGFDYSLLRYEFVIPQGLAPPIEEGAVLGNVAVYVENFRIGNAPLLATQPVLEYTAASGTSTNYITGGGLQYIPEHYQGLYLDGNTESTGYYEHLSPIWADEIFLTFAVPLAISGITLLVSLIIYFAKRKDRMRRKLHARYARYPQYYRYK